MKELKDTQSETDDRNISIDRVGVKGVRYPITVMDKENREQSTVAEFSLAVDLPKEFKGTHMSRFVEVLHELGGSHMDVHSAFKIPRELLKRLPATRSHVSISFPFFRTKHAPVTGRPGLMDYEIRFELEAEVDKKVDFVLTVKVPVTTLCPCSKAISDSGAHNQRGIVTYSVRFTSEPVWIEDLIDLVEECASCALFSVLKRPDEKWVTEHAYQNPVFVEDLVRNVAIRSERHSVFTWYKVEAENFESIHNHQAYAVVERFLAGGQ